MIAVSRYVLGGELQPSATKLHPKEDSFLYQSFLLEVEFGCHGLG